MKILLVNMDKGWGGGQELMTTLAAGLCRAGCTVHVLCRSSSPSERSFADLGFPVHGVCARGIGRVGAIVKTAALFRQEMFDVVLVNREHDLLRTMLGWQLAFPFRKPGKFVMCYHTATSRRQHLLGFVDAIICISTYVRERLLAGNGGVDVPVEILPNGIRVMGDVSPSKFRADRERRFFKGAAFPLIGMVGAFFKNQAELLDVIPPVLREFPTLKVALVGDDGDAGLVSPLKKKVSDLGLGDSIIFTGKVPHERMADVFHDLDLSVSTYRNEGFGLVHLESLAAGTPVVVYDEGGQTDIFSGAHVGVLVRGGANEMAAAIVSLLKNDPVRHNMGHAGRNLVLSRYSEDEMVRRYVKFFQKICRSPERHE